MLDATQSGKKKKPHAWTKYPDAAIIFTGDVHDPLERELPSIVFEAGFTESHDDLISDAKQWLTKSHGDVRLVIIVDIKETVRVRRDTKEFRRKHRDLKIQFGNNKGKRQDDIDSDSDNVESDGEMYKSIRSTIQTDEWVGPLVVTAELWHMVDSQPQRRGPQIVRFHYCS